MNFCKNHASLFANAFILKIFDKKCCLYNKENFCYKKKYFPISEILFLFFKVSLYKEKGEN